MTQAVTYNIYMPVLWNQSGREGRDRVKTEREQREERRGEREGGRERERERERESMRMHEYVYAAVVCTFLRFVSTFDVNR